MRDLILPSLAAKGRDNIRVFDSLTEFADTAEKITDRGSTFGKASHWTGGREFDETARFCRIGNLSRVAASDGYLTKLEDLTGFEAKTFRRVSDLSGGVPNVPAFLAGHPLDMRRRQRVMSEQAPLNIVVDIASSAGIRAEDLERRGAAILALVRILTALRPVSLYIGNAGMPYGNGRPAYLAVASVFPIDTAPLDLARAAHALSAPGVARQLGYLECCVRSGQGSNAGINWAYGDVETYRKHGVQFWQRAIGTDELLFVAPTFVNDETITAPEKWLRAMIDRYGQGREG